MKKPITFDEALESGKRVRCEHEFIDLSESERLKIHCLTKAVNEYKENKYLPMTEMFLLLSWCIQNGDIKQVLKEGEWYTED